MIKIVTREKHQKIDAFIFVRVLQSVPITKLSRDITEYTSKKNCAYCKKK